SETRNAIVKMLRDIDKTDLSKTYPGNPVMVAENTVAQTNKGMEILKGVEKVTASNKNYNYIDHNANGVNYYRLQLKNKNGSVSYSNIVKLETKNEKHFIDVYPNPAKDVLNITIQSALAGKTNIIITDLSGKIFISKEITS